MNSWRDQGEGARQLWERDTCALAHDITIEEVGDGHARLRMPVRSDMANGHGICHGGIIFLLADTALAYASVTPDQTQTNVASNASIVFTCQLLPLRLRSRYPRCSSSGLRLKNLALAEKPEAVRLPYCHRPR